MGFVGNLRMHCNCSMVGLNQGIPCQLELSMSHLMTFVAKISFEDPLWGMIVLTSCLPSIANVSPESWPMVLFVAVFATLFCEAALAFLCDLASIAILELAAIAIFELAAILLVLAAIALNDFCFLFPNTSFSGFVSKF